MRFAFAPLGTAKRGRLSTATLATWDAVEVLTQNHQDTGCANFFGRQVVTAVTWGILGPEHTDRAVIFPARRPGPWRRVVEGPRMRESGP